MIIIKQKQCIQCGGTEFSASQKNYHDVVVSGNNHFLRDVGVFESETPYGPYACTGCGAGYGDLCGLVEAESGISKPHTEVSAFEQHKLTGGIQKAIHLSWDRLDAVLSGLLTSLLGKDINAYSERDGHYYWLLSLDDDMTPEDLDALLTISGATDFDRDANDFYGAPILELSEGLCNKLMGKLLPFRLELSLADGDGVWFIGRDEPE